MEYTQSEIEQIVALCRELLNTNETLNAQLIALMAKLGNEEKKVKQLSQTLQLLISNQKIYNA
jgi:hypothetical protein